MTELVLNYSSGLLETIWKNIKGFGRSCMVARQLQANREIAEHMWRIGEYNNYQEALQSLNKRTLEYLKND